MKRGEVLQDMLMAFGGSVAIHLDYGEGINVDAGLMLMIWRYLQEEIGDGQAQVETVQKEPEIVQKEPEIDQGGPGTGRGKVDVGKVIALYKAGWSMSQIADEIGCTNSVITYHVNKAIEAGELERRNKITRVGH